MRRQFKALAGALLQSAESNLAEWLPAGKKKGGEWCVGSIRGEAGESCKINLSTGVGMDFATGEKFGDLVNVYAAIHGLSQAEAYDTLAPRYGLNGIERELPPPASAPPRRDAKPEPRIAFPAPDDYPRKGSIQYEYRAQTGELMFVVCRVERPDGGKDFLPLRPVITDDGAIEWEMRAYPEPRPLYGLAQLAAKDASKKVIVVEGEKAAEALLERRPGNTILTWSGGSRAWQKSDWTPIFGREVILWPDNDEAGREAMRGIAELLHSHGCVVHILGTAEELLEVEGGDCADIPTEKRFAVLAKLLEDATVLRPDTIEPPPEPKESGDEPSAPPETNMRLPVPLGILGDEFVLLDRRGPKLYRFGFSGLRAALPNLAALDDWQASKFFNDGRVNWDKAVNEYIDTCTQVGIVKPERVRDVGVWMDSGRVVANIARHQLWVDGDAVRPSAIDSWYIYVSRDGWREVAQPLDTATASTVLSAMGRLAFAHPYHAIALAGWIAVAPLAGALPWRPNIWLSAPSGGGKTWVLDNIVTPLLRAHMFRSNGATTEAGVRQQCNGKAIPIVWDEFEAETIKDAEAKRHLMDLVRSASTGEPLIVKGGQSGASQSFSVPFMFLFASIHARLVAAADANRTVNVELRPKPKEGDEREARMKDFRELQRITGNWPIDIGDRWLWRAILGARTILASIKTLKPLIAAIQDERTADVHSALIAGYWSIGHDEPISQEDAEEIVAGMFADYMQYSTSADSVALDAADEYRALDLILDHIESVTVDDKTRRVSLREIVLSAVSSPQTWRPVLQRYGLGVSEDRAYLQVSSGHNFLARVLAGTQFAQQWNQVLGRLPGAKKMLVRGFVEGNQRVKRRTVEIPISLCRGEFNSGAQTGAADDDDE